MRLIVVALLNLGVRPKLEEQMLITHLGKKPEVHTSTYIAPTATICGDVTIGPNCRVVHGASIIVEGGKFVIYDYA